jgi:hypothetical protein
MLIPGETGYGLDGDMDRRFHSTTVRSNLEGLAASNRPRTTHANHLLVVP